MYRIEKNHPIPEQKRATKFPWADMEVGDSFFVKGRKSTSFAVPRKFRQNGFKVRAAVRDGGVRVWRIS